MEEWLVPLRRVLSVVNGASGGETRSKVRI